MHRARGRSRSPLQSFLSFHHVSQFWKQLKNVRQRCTEGLSGSCSALLDCIGICVSAFQEPVSLGMLERTAKASRPLLRQCAAPCRLCLCRLPRPPSRWRKKNTERHQPPWECLECFSDGVIQLIFGSEYRVSSRRFGLRELTNSGLKV